MTTIDTGSATLDAFNLFYTIMTDQITDTSSDSRVGSDFIKSAWPNRHNHPESKWVNYPIVVIEVNDGNFVPLGMRNNFPEGTLEVQYDVYDKSKKNNDTIANQIAYVLKKYKDQLEGSGYRNLVLGSSNSPFSDPSNAQVHLKTIRAEYKYRENFTQA